MSHDVTTTMGIDFTDVEEDLEAMEQKAKATKRKIDREARSAIQTLGSLLRTGIYAIGILSGSTNQALLGVVEGLVLAGESLLTLATAESVTGLGLLKAGATFTAAFTLMAQSAIVATRAEQIDARTSQSIIFLRAAALHL